MTGQLDKQDRQAFIAELAEAIRTVSDAPEITKVATHLLGKALEATRAYFVTWPPGEDYGEVAPDYAVAGARSIAGRCPIDSVGSAYSHLLSGDSWIVDDARHMPGLDKDERAFHLARNAMAWVNIPLVGDGVLKAALCVVQDKPRKWTPGEISLIEDVAERCWSEVERSRAETALRRSDGRYRSLFDAIDEGFCVIEFRFDASDGRADYRVIEANPAFYEETGFSRDIAGRWLREAAPDLEEHWYEIYGRVATTREPVRFEQKSDLLGRWFEVYAFPTGDPDDLRIAVLFKNVTARKQSDAHQKMLMAELDHRVKNMLAVVKSIMQQTIGRGDTPEPGSAARLLARITALSKSHSLLAHNRWEGASLDDVVENALAPYRDGATNQITTQGPSFRISPKAAQTMSLALHELVTNAAKHGALSCEEGRVRIEWTLIDDKDDPRLHLTWREDGGPPIDAKPARTGFGFFVITNTLTYELGGIVKTEFAREGLNVFCDLSAEKLRSRGQFAKPVRRRDTARATEGDAKILRGKKVLVIDDEHLMAEGVIRVLRQAGCKTLQPRASLATGLQAAAIESVDAAVLDVNLGGDLAWPIARLLWARDIPMVFVTGHSDALSAPPELDHVRRLEKPAPDDVLLSSLAAAIAERNTSLPTSLLT